MVPIFAKSSILSVCKNIFGHKKTVYFFALTVIALLAAYLIRRCFQKRQTSLEKTFANFKPRQNVVSFPLFLHTNEDGILRTYDIVTDFFPQACQGAKKNVVIGTSGFFLLNLVSQFAKHPAFKDKELGLLITEASPRTLFFWKNAITIIKTSQHCVDAFNKLVEHLSRYSLFYWPIGSDSAFRNQVHLSCQAILMGLHFLSDQTKYAFVQKMIQKGNLKVLFIDLNDTPSIKQLKKKLNGDGWNVSLFYRSNLEEHLSKRVLMEHSEILLSPNSLMIDAKWKNGKLYQEVLNRTYLPLPIHQKKWVTCTSKTHFFVPAIANQNSVEIALRVCSFLGEKRLLFVALLMTKARKGFSFFKASTSTKRQEFLREQNERIATVLENDFEKNLNYTLFPKKILPLADVTIINRMKKELKCKRQPMFFQFTIDGKKINWYGEAQLFLFIQFNEKIALLGVYSGKLRNDREHIMQFYKLEDKGDTWSMKPFIEMRFQNHQIYRDLFIAEY